MTFSDRPRWIMLVAFLALLLGGCGGVAPSRAPQARYGGGAGRAEKAPGGPSFSGEESDGAPAPSTPAPAPGGGAVGRNELGAPAEPPPAPPPPPPGTKAPGQGKDGQRAEGTEAAHDTSMLIYTAHLTMAVYQVDQGLTAVEKIARDNGGYLSAKRDHEIIVRVPRARFEPALAQVDKIGDIIHRDVQALDVTDEFVDTEIRIKNARATQARLRTLLDRAGVKEALEIERELRRVTDELELLEGKLKLLKDKIAYSTITVTFQPRGATVQATQIRLPFPWLTQIGLPALLQLSEAR